MQFSNFCLDIVAIFIVSYCNDIWNLYYKAEDEGLNGFLYISITGQFIIVIIIFRI